MNISWCCGFTTGLALEKWFVFFGWPDETMTMAVIATAVALLSGIAVVATEGKPS